MPKLTTIFLCVLAAVALTQRALPLSSFIPGKEFKTDSEADFYKQVLPITEALSLRKLGGVLFVDTRAATDFEQERIDSAISIDAFHGVTNERVLLFYGYGDNVKYVQTIAEKWDLKQGRIYVLEGGFEKWKALDLPTTK